MSKELSKGQLETGLKIWRSRTWSVLANKQMKNITKVFTPQQQQLTVKGLNRQKKRKETVPLSLSSVNLIKEIPGLK